MAFACWTAFVLTILDSSIGKVMRKASESLPVTPAVSEIGKVKHRENEHKDQRFENTDILLIRSAWTVTVNIVVQLDETELFSPHNAPFLHGSFHRNAMADAELAIRKTATRFVVPGSTQ